MSAFCNEGANEMIILQRDSRYEVGDPDCVFKVKSGDLITPIKRIGYKTTFDDWEDYGEITDEDIEDLYIFCCPNNDETQTEVYISICSNWDLILLVDIKVFSLIIQSLLQQRLMHGLTIIWGVIMNTLEDILNALGSKNHS